jgi:hypothetical protein
MSSKDHEVLHYAVFSSPLAINPFRVETSVALIQRIFLLPDLAQGGQHRSLCGRNVCSTESSQAMKSSPCILSRMKRGHRAFSKVFLDISGSHRGVGEIVTEVDMYVSVGKA